MEKTYSPEPYWDQVARMIKSRGDIKVIAGDDEPYYRYKRKRFLQLLDSINFTDREVLEIGSGPGGNLDYIRSKGCRRLCGADISSQMVSLAQELLKGKGVEIFKTNGTELPFEAGAFDTVFTSTVLQHNTNEDNLIRLINEICRVTRDEVLLFERIESRIKGHESCLGRPIPYYAKLMGSNGLKLVQTKPMPLQASYYVCGAIRKLLNPRTRMEGEPLTPFSIALERILLPITSILDLAIPSRRDVMLLRFKRT